MERIMDLQGVECGGLQVLCANLLAARVTLLAVHTGQQGYIRRVQRACRGFAATEFLLRLFVTTSTHPIGL